MSILQENDLETSTCEKHTQVLSLMTRFSVMFPIGAFLRVGFKDITFVGLTLLWRAALSQLASQWGNWYFSICSIVHVHGRRSDPVCGPGCTICRRARQEVRLDWLASSFLTSADNTRVNRPPLFLPVHALGHDTSSSRLLMPMEKYNKRTSFHHPLDR